MSRLDVDLVVCRRSRGGDAFGLEAAFSADGTQIAFHSWAGDGIYVMGQTGGNVTQLTTRGFDPAWVDAAEVLLGECFF